MVGNWQDAEELVQDVFLNAYQKLEQLKDAAKFLPWLKQIARNQCKMYWCQAKPEIIPITDGPQLVDSYSTVEPEMLRRELLDATLKAIEALPAKDRQISQSHLDGQSHAAISAETSLSYRASLNRRYRIRQKMKAKLRHLLGGVGISLKWFSSLERFSGGMALMRVTTNAKIATGVAGKNKRTIQAPRSRDVTKPGTFISVDVGTGQNVEWI